MVALSRAGWDGEVEHDGARCKLRGYREHLQPLALWGKLQLGCGGKLQLNALLGSCYFNSQRVLDVVLAHLSLVSKQRL